MTERNEEIERLKKELNRLKSENASLIRANKMHNISRDIDITSEQFDSILSEIDEKEKQTSKTSHMEPTANVYWVGLQNDMAVHKTDKVKQMIINGELNAEKHGMRLICQAAHNGCADIIDTIKMYWKCVTPKMYDTAIITAEKRGNFHIANQLYFAKIGKEAKQHVIKMLEKLKRDKSVNDYLCKSKHIPFLELTLQNVIEALELRNPFSADMLSLAWHYCWYYRKNRSDILDSKLWHVMSTQLEDIINNIQSKQRDFLWLTTWLLPCTIFYCQVNGKPLFERATDIVNRKANKEGAKRLNNIILKVQQNNEGKEWNDLQEYGIEDESN
eukprot:46731_1